MTKLKEVFICPLCCSTDNTQVEPLTSKRGFILHHRIKCDKCGFTDRKTSFQGVLGQTTTNTITYADKTNGSVSKSRPIE